MDAPWYLSLSSQVYDFAISILWIVFAFVVLGAVLWKVPLSELVTSLTGRLRGLKVAGVELSFVEAKMEQAAAAASTNNVRIESTVPKKIEITRADRERAIARAQRAGDALSGKRILWIDDEVTNNRLERMMLEAFGMTIEQVQDNAAAEKALRAGGHDLILSDIARGKDAQGQDILGGLDFLASHRTSSYRLPVIFYVSVVDEDRPLPPGAFGLTNRPDELLHLVVDALERRA